MINKALRRFSSLKLPLFLHLDHSTQRKYIVSQSTTLSQLQAMLQQSDPTLQNTRFYLRDA